MEIALKPGDLPKIPLNDLRGQRLHVIKKIGTPRLYMTMYFSFMSFSSREFFIFNKPILITKLFSSGEL